MTTFDWAIVAVVAVSILLAFVRGITRELVALVAWVVGLIAAVTLSPLVGGWLPELGGEPAVRYLIAFAVILIATLVAGAFIAWPLRSFIRRAGLGFVDRFLGALFGVARGVVAVLAFVLVAGLTTLPRHDWWQNAALAPPLAVAAHALAPWLPREWASALDYSREGRTLKSRPAERKA
jgi:membrane protein required for colicin V production